MKSDGSLVTAADRELEAFLTEALSREFPGTGIVGEEGANVEGADRWHIDPIDGTTAFVQRLAHWGPTICLVQDGRLEVGAFYMPRLDEFWFAQRGGGAWLDDTRLSSPDPGRVERQDALFAPSNFHRRSPVPWPGKIRALGSSAAHLALVAAGSGLLTVIPKWELWDIGCGVLLMEEAGRRVCDAVGEGVEVTTCRTGLPILAGASTALNLLTADGWAKQALE